MNRGESEKVPHFRLFGAHRGPLAHSASPQVDQVDLGAVFLVFFDLDRLLGPLVADFGDHVGDLALFFTSSSYFDDPTRLLLARCSCFLAPRTVHDSGTNGFHPL